MPPSPPNHRPRGTEALQRGCGAELGSWGTPHTLRPLVCSAPRGLLQLNLEPCCLQPASWVLQLSAKPWAAKGEMLGAVGGAAGWPRLLKPGFCPALSSLPRFSLPFAASCFVPFVGPFPGDQPVLRTLCSFHNCGFQISAGPGSANSTFGTSPGSAPLPAPSRPHQCSPASSEGLCCPSHGRWPTAQLPPPLTGNAGRGSQREVGPEVLGCTPHRSIPAPCSAPGCIPVPLGLRSPRERSGWGEKNQ